MERAKLINILVGELRGIWEKADPFPTTLIVEAARNLGFTKEDSDEKILQDLKFVWNRCEVKGKDFIQFETALLRLGKDWCRKKKCQQCSFSSNCQRF